MRLLIAAFSLAVACTAAQAQENIFHRMVGVWRDTNTAAAVDIKPDGSVFAKSGSLRGSVARSITGGGNFTFENEQARCSYDIVIYDDDTRASWALANEVIISNSGAEPVSCPKSANLIRVETPEEKFVRLEAVRQAAMARQNAIRQAELDRIAREQKEAADRAAREAAQAEAARQAELERLRAIRQAEIDRQNAIRQAEIDRQNAIRQAELDRIARERQAEIDRELANKRAEEAARAKYAQVAGECDRLAASPTDKGKPADVVGTPWKELKFYADEAVVACGKALKVYIDHPRLVFQMARALQWSSNKNGGQRAFALYGKAVSWNYPAAYDNLGSMYRDGKYTTQDPEKAMALFRKGAALGDTDATYSVAYALLKQEKLQEGLSWLKRAVEMGSEPAAELMQKYREAELEAKQRAEQYRQQQQNFQQQWQTGRQQQVPPDARIMLDIFGGIFRNMR